MHRKSSNARYSRDRRAKYAQNYIKNPALARKLLLLCGFDKSLPVFELGSGRGIFTKELLSHTSKLYSIDIDKENIQYLHDFLQKHIEKGVLDLFNEDALSFELKFSCPNLAHGEYNLFGNIPYNISSALVKRYLLRNPMPKRACLTVQKEFALRMLGKRKEKEKGLLHLLLDTFYDMQIVYEYRKEDFSPVPSVDSVLFSFSLRNNLDRLFFEDLGDYKNMLNAAYRQPVRSIEAFLRDKLERKRLQQIADKNKFKLKDKCATLDAKHWVSIFKALQNKR